MRILILSLLIVCDSLAIHGQCTDRPADPCVAVNQSILDRSKHALDELAAARESLKAYASLQTLTDLERKTYQSALTAADAVIAAQAKGIADRDHVIEMFQKAFDAVMALNERLTKQLSKGKSGWERFLATLEKFAMLALGITIGHGF